MAKDKLPKAQTGTSIPAPSIPKPMLDEGFMEERFGGYKAPTGMPEFQFDTVTAAPIGSSEPEVNSVEALMNKVRSTSSGEGVGPMTRTGDQYVGSERYDYFNPDAGWDNEDAAAQGQGWGAQMVNGVSKGLALTGTTFLQNTVGLVNGTFQAISDGRMASFYDNDFNRALDKFNKKLEDALPNYYTAVSRDADWYSPDYWMTGNFLWDGVVKNMGFAAGTYLSAGVYTNILKGIPLASKLFSTGKAGEAIAATEAGLAGGKGASGIYGQLKILADSFLKVAGGYNTLNKGQRVLVSGLSTTGEAGFEGLHNMNDFRQKLISKYREEKGVVPNGEDLAEINKIADAAGNSSMFANMMLLTATNYIQLPKIMSSSYSAEKTLLNGLGKETKDIIFDEAGRASRKQVSKLGRVVNAIRKPYIFSYSEALEESSQFGIGTATEDYYDKAYNGEATSWMESVGVGITQGMFSNEGAKNALIGGLSGAIMMNGIPSVRSLVDKNYETENQRLSRQTDKAVNEFNSSNLPEALKQMKFQLSNFTEETKEAVNRGTVLQTEREASLKAGDIFTSKNLEADYIINYLTPRIKYGRFDLVKSEIDEYKTLASTDAGFEQLVKEGKANQTDTKEAYAARLQRFEETANSAYSFYQSLNLRYGSAFNVDEDDEPILDKDGKGTLKYPPSVMNKMLYTALKTEDFDQRIITLEGKLTAAGINTSEVLKSVVDGNFEAYNKAVEQIKSLDILGEKKDTLGSYLDDLADAAAQRQTFIKTYEDIKENPSKYLSEPIKQEQTDTPDVAPETIKVQTEKGVVDVEVETEYFVGNSVDYNEDGLDEIFKIGTLIVKGYNEDGTLKIVNTKTGEERNLTRGTFNKLKLGKVSTTRNNKTANYFYNHRNEIFELNRGKNFGGRVRGRLEYDNGKLYFVYKTKGSDKTTKVETTQADVKQKVSKLEKRINRAKSMFANAKTGAEKAEALIFFLNNAHHTDESVNEEDMAWFNNAKKEVEADGYIIDNEIGREISENENVEFGIQKESDSVPKGTIIVNYVTKPRRVVDGKQVESAKYDVLVGTGTTEERDILLQEFKDAQDALDPKDLEGTRGRYDAAKKALKEYDDANFTKPGAEVKLKKELTTYKKAAPKAKTKVSYSNIKRKQLDNSFFVPQEGYDLPRITRVGSVQSKDQKASEQQFTSPQEIAKNKKTLAKNREARLEVLTQLGEEGKQNIAELEKTITKASEDLAKVKEDLANIRKMKKAGPDGPKIKLTFSKATKSFTRSINKLTQMRKDLNKTIKLAEAEREEVLNDISYFEQYANEISDAPEDSGEFLKELKSQVKILADNGKNLANIIKAAKKMGTTLRQVTKKAASLFKKAIKSTYIVDDTYAQSLNDLLSDVAAGRDLDVTWPALKQEIVNFQLTNDISKDVNLNEADIENTVSEVRKLESDITELRNEYRARKIILDRFQSIMNEYNAQKAAEQKIINDQKLLDKILDTGIKATPLKEYEGPYNPIKLKPTDILPVATNPINEGKDHQTRANTFGANLNSFENRDDIRGIYLTSAIQDQLLPGVVERMLDGDPDLIKKFKDSMIIMVMVNENGELVGEDGQPIPEGEALLDNAIYQAMPEAGLTNTKGSMFREGTDEAVKTSVTEQYAKFRQTVLGQSALGIPQVIEASFGSPKYSIDSNGNNVYTDVTSVQDAGLIDEVSLEKKPLIFVPKSKGTVSEGTVSYDSPLGRVFLRMPNAYVPLRNRKHTRKEATVIFETILQLSKNITQGEGVESDSSIDLLNFLKRVTYWGMPLDSNGERKEPGRNSVFFQRTDPDAGGGLEFTKLQLVIGKSPDSKFDFAPSELEMQKDLIISVLENTYNNVNAYDQILNDLDAEFQQIVGVEDGEIQDVIWPNYQTYLLSNTNPDGSTRESYELPLHTNLKVKEEGEVSRENIYFFSKTGQENYTVPSPAAQRQKVNQATNLPITKEGKAVVTPSAPSTPSTPTQSKGSKFYTLDGETMNQYVFADGQILSFKWRQQKGVVPAKEQIVIYNQPGDNFQEIIDAIPVKSTNVPEEIKKKKSDYLKGLIFTAIEAQLAYEKAKFAFSVEISDAAVEKGEAEGGGRGLFDDVAPVTPAPAEQTSNVETVNYNGTKYSVDFNIGSGTITNLKTGKVIDSTSSLGSTIVDLATMQQGSESPLQTSEVGALQERVNIIVESNMRDVFNLVIEDARQRGETIKGLNVNDVLDNINNEYKELEKAQSTLKKYYNNNTISNLTKEDIFELEDFITSQFGLVERFLSNQQTLSLDPTEDTPSQGGLNYSDSIEDALSDMNDEHFREVIEAEMSLFEEENWKEVASWMKKNLPTVQLNRVKNIIQAGGGRLAWGMFKSNAIYVYENAEVGTLYHEAFEAVFNQFLSAEEVSKLRTDFKQRKGTFVDRPTGQEIKFSEATGQQMKEHLAEEFRDYVKNNKQPKGFFAKVFKQLKDLIEKWFTSSNSDTYTNELFDRINTGFYASPEVKKFSELKGYKIGDGNINDMLYAPNSENAEFRVIPLNDKEIYDTIQEMTYQLVTEVIKDDDNLFNLDALVGTEVETYKRLQTRVIQVARQKQVAINKYILANESKLTDKDRSNLNILIAKNKKLEKNILQSWPVLIERHKQYLQSFNISFDQGSQDQLDDNDRIRESNKFDASKIDSLKAASASLKLLLSTLQVRNNETGKPIISSINGSVLQPYSKTAITLMANLHTSESPDEMMVKLQELAKNNATYAPLYARIMGKGINEGAPTFDNVTKQKSRMITAMWRTLKKQAPEVLNTYVFEDGITVQPAAYSTASEQVKADYLNGISSQAKSNNGFFNYNPANGKYTPKRLELNNVALNTPTAMSNFLLRLGIAFSDTDMRKLYRIGKQEDLKKVVQSIKDSVSSIQSVTTFSQGSLDISGRLRQLAFLQVTATNPDFDSTYNNVSGEKVQTYFGVNAIDKLFVALQNVKNKSELAGTQFEYLLTDEFSQGSNLMSRMFASDGSKKANTDELLKPGIAGGIVYEKKKNSASTRLTDKERYIQELNLNLDGRFMNLVPGDASLEHMVNMGKAVKASQLSDMGLARVISNIFKPYLLSEINLSRADRYIPELKYEEGTPEFDKRKNTDLRFFKDILGETLHNEVVSQEGTPEEVYELYKNKIDESITKYIKGWVSKNYSYLDKFEMIDVSGDIVNNYNIENVAFPKNMNADKLTRELTAVGINYMVANIEMHKLLYSDPYQYKDELKRTKSFLSPSQVLVNNSPLFQAQQNIVWNEGYEKGDIGYYNLMKDYFNTATHEDVIGAIDLPGYEAYEETDGAGIISFPAYRAMRIQADNWNDAEEKQYRYDIAYEKKDKSIKLTPEEKALLNDKTFKMVKSAYPDQKPIVSGSRLAKDGGKSSFNNVVLDKYSLYPLSYRVMKEMNAGNAINLYNKMQKESVDYIIFRSARKVGAPEKAHETYNKETGEFNNEPYEETIKVPFSIMGIQSEVPSKEKDLVTRGSQPTKLITLDMFDNGVPIDFKHFTGKNDAPREEQWALLTDEERLEQSDIFKESENNTEILDALTEDSYERVLRRLGIVETDDGRFVIEDFSEATKTLRSELFKREVNDNISDALTNFLDKGTTLETTPVYQQVRNILYSIVNKELVKPKISGGLKTQIPSTFFESTKTKYNDKLNGYTSDTLDFYVDEDGKRVMEIMVGRWFKSDMNDKDLLEYLNKKENQGILEGLAFRTPTQAQNSIDVIRVARLLPREFGDNVVVPSAIVEKVGSDFDIYKLAIYLKNVFYRKGKLEVVPFFGTGSEAKNEFAKMFDGGQLLTSSQKKQLDALGQLKSWEVQGLINNEETDLGFGDLLAQLGIVEQEDSLETFINELSEIGVRDTIINRLYKQSLENGYITSSRNIVSHPQNFENLIRPNSAKQLQDLSKRVVNKLFGEPFNYTKVDNLLNNRFMLRLRQAFVSGKRAIGIAAVAQTGHSQNQKTIITVDTDKIENMTLEDQYWLGDGQVKFENYNKSDGKASLSGIYNADGQLISNINSQLMDGYVDISKGPWIMEMGATPQAAPTILFLNSIGVPIDQIIFFINQPIIREYLLTLENKGKRWIYNDAIMEDLLSKYNVRDFNANTKNDFVIEDAVTLEENLGKTNFSEKEANQQGAYLMEFLKYSRMSSQYYTFTAGTNFDTAMLNDPFLIFKKKVAYGKAKSSVIAGAESKLASGFVRKLGQRLGILSNDEGKGNTRDALSNFLLSDRGNVRTVLETVLLPYTERPDKEFVRIARKAVNNLFDWAMQTKGLNTQIEKILLNDDGVAAQVGELINKIKTSKKGSPYFSMINNLVVSNLEVLPSRKAGAVPNNLRLGKIGTQAYEVNSIIYSFRELRTFLEDMGQSELYDGIVKLSVLQSGLSSSPISFTSYLPQEDVDKIYKYTLPLLENLPNLQSFADLNMFQRNNWQDDTIVRADSLFMLTPKATNNVKSASFPSIAAWARPDSVNTAFQNGNIPLTITQNVSNFKAGDDTMVFSWTDLSYSRTEVAAMRKAGNYDYVKKGLFKIVRDPEGLPIVHNSENKKKGTVDKYYIYKHINAFGDSYRAQEFYTNARKSVIDNGLMKANEKSDLIVSSAWDGSLGKAFPSVLESGETYFNKLNDGTFLLADNGKYKPSEITSEMLLEMGYPEDVTGRLIKLICKG